ncbi:aminodeoxychorismate synthase component I [Actinoalloteichus caeruleus]|uniref:aminodeoxychorismate synthase component I n=1 Tax=Actinoalloteichus cyanogriseus TaxID=2893586 RepID=UPI0006875D8B
MAWRWDVPGGTTPGEVLDALGARATRSGTPGPAALSGDWFGSAAVIAPSVRLEPVPPAEAFHRPVTWPVTEDPGLPAGVVGGGWFGYLGYGLTDPGVWDRARRMPAAVWGYADHVLRLDQDGNWWFEALVPAGGEEPVALAAELAEVVRADGCPVRGDGDGDDPGMAGPPARSPVRLPGAERHEGAVLGALAAIGAGEVFQANVCTEIRAGFQGDPLELFVRGVSTLAPARAAYLSGGWGAVVSLSPELFLARRGRTVRTSPIKGTLPRRGPADDGNAGRLRASVKDVAENVMIVDMARNDLGRVCQPGSVTVPSLLGVEPHPGVWHLVSTVVGELRRGVSDAELLAATFPPASVTGAPKVRALELIAELEATPREVYCGAVGLVSPVAGMELNVAIRTLEYAPTPGGAELALGVGGGITADSVPAVEWAECRTKAAPLLALLADQERSEVRG